MNKLGSENDDRGENEATSLAVETRATGWRPQGPVGLVAVILSGHHKGHTHTLGGQTRIGKAPDNDLVLTDDTVSRHHCELLRAPDGVHVRDLDSTNGTRVDGTRIREAVLHAGQVLKVGEVEISIRPMQQKLELLPSDKTSFGGAIAQSLAMRTIFGVLERIAPTDATVLLEGETGTGKDVLARAIWMESTRASKPFIVVDCGAVASRQGAFELADNGTVFLDEIGELPLDVQPKLLRVLETRELRRVGGNKTVRTNVRVIAATKRDLTREVQNGKFREDLYFRLAVVPVTVPPLRSRREDIPYLVTHMLKSAASGGEVLTVSSDTMQGLMAHDWPGNVRELRNVLERAVYMSQATGSRELGGIALPSSGSHTTEGSFHFEPGKSYRETRAKYDSDFERRYIKWLLGRHNGNVSAAAREAKMDRKHLHDMAKKHGLRGNENEGD